MPTTDKILAPCCVLVIGHNNSCIYDLQRNGIYRFPNKYLCLFEVDKETGIYKVNSIDANFDNSQAFIDTLISNQLCISTTVNHFFRPIDLTYYPQRICENAIIDRDKYSSYSMSSLAEKLSDVGCGAISIRYLYPVKLTEIERDVIEFNNSTVRDIEIHCNILEGKSIENIKDFKRRYGRVCSFVFYEERERKVNHIGSNLTVVTIDKPLLKRNMCGGVSEFNMRAQTQFYIESKTFNNCLYRKICIDENGLIKNCPLMTNNYGHLDDHSHQFRSIMKSEKFQEYWSITKDSVDDCKNCEFRYACLDCRCQAKNQNNTFTKQIKCEYNP
ncbi:hypothetical protein QYZ87_09890 [Porphyromonadaceae bacterium W3.11]|nr:hypothetical protein [Porphyromonadaceae bacterium W3.11]